MAGQIGHRTEADLSKCRGILCTGPWALILGAWGPDLTGQVWALILGAWSPDLAGQVCALILGACSPDLAGQIGQRTEADLSKYRDILCTCPWALILGAWSPDLAG